MDCVDFDVHMSSFESFQGNERIVRTLRLALEGGRVPHSLLFAGPEGIGKRTLALMLAKALNCGKRQHDFCDACSSCSRIEAGTHPDVEYIGVLEDRQFLSIDQIRKAKRDVFFQPFEGRSRVFVIDEADRMKDEAANSILKMLEEPPPSTKLVLITTKFQALLPTIRSRCQAFNFSPLSLNDILHFLETRGEVPPSDRPLCARVAEGSIGRAISIDLESFRSMRAEVLDFIKAMMMDPAPSSIFSLADTIGRDKQNFEERMKLFYLLFQDLFYLFYRVPEERMTNVDLLATLRPLVRKLSPRWLQQVFDRLDAIVSGGRVNINRPIALEDMAFQLGSFSAGHSEAPSAAASRPLR